ncbi:MAG: hypothetical protein ACM3XM_08260 [Mycobacterium leprae]
MRYRRCGSLMLLLALLAGCSHAAPQTAPAATQAAPTVVEVPPPTPPVRPDARLLVSDPIGHLIADVDQRLRILDYEGHIISEPILSGGPVQWVGWAPRGDQLLAITGKQTAECCDLFQDAHYWLVPMTPDAPRELTGLPQEVEFTWASDEQSLYVLDNWRRNAPIDALGERLQRYDLKAGTLTLLIDRTSRLTNVAELPGGDLLVRQYGGGGHGFYYRLPAGGGPLVTAAPFHMNLSPDGRWAVETNPASLTELAVADVATGVVTRFEPDPKWPRPTGDHALLRLSDPVWAPDSRWLMYVVRTDGFDPAELRFFDRTKAEPDRVIPSAYGAWLTGEAPQALVLRLTDGQVEPWRYDVSQGKLSGPLGPKVPAGGGNVGSCLPLSDIRVSATTAAYMTCHQDDHTLVYLDLTGQTPGRLIPIDRPAWLLALSADGNTAALEAETEGGRRELRLERLHE